MNSGQNSSRRSFLGTSVGTLASGVLLTGSVPPTARADEKSAAKKEGRGRNRVGAVAYSYQYSIGLFAYKDRPEERFDALKFVEATHQAGGEVAQLYYTQIRDLDEGGLKRLRQRAEELDVLLEVHGGVALGKWSKFEDTMQRAATLGSKVIGCSFGFLMRPERINTLDAWDAHTKQCEARLRELAPLAKSLGLTVAVENHLDFSVEELRDLIKSVNSPNVGVLFDVGNILGTLDDPTEAADILGPLTVATHYKDFAIEEVARGFRFCMVPLGCGSLRLPEITERLLKHVDPEMGMSIEMINGQHFELNWLERSVLDCLPQQDRPSTGRHATPRPRQGHRHRPIQTDRRSRQAAPRSARAIRTGSYGPMHHVPERAAGSLWLVMIDNDPLMCSKVLEIHKSSLSAHRYNHAKIFDDASLLYY